MKKKQPEKQIAWIFGILGAAFLLLGFMFLAVKWHLISDLTDPALWARGDLPDAYALPLMGLIFSAVGCVFGAVSVVMRHASQRQEELREELLRFGTRMTGTVQEVRQDLTIQVNGRHPLRVWVRVKTPDGGEMRLRSHRVWETALREGDRVEVAFDPLDDKRCMVLLDGDETEN